MKLISYDFLIGEGYLYTNEDMDIGNHDLLDNLFSHLGKYLYLELEVFDEILT